MREDVPLFPASDPRAEIVHGTNVAVDLIEEVAAEKDAVLVVKRRVRVEM